MRLSISNIAWSTMNDETVYAMMHKYGFTGLEIAPTRIFPENPYGNLSQARNWAQELQNAHGLTISSMQSIWYGRLENLFGTDKEREILVEYTKKAIDFASVLGCRNLVFGCPKNRNLPDVALLNSGITFFKTIGDYALSKGTVIGMEANPPIYNTNYVNDTLTALQLVEQVGSEGFKVNLDVGTMIENKESTNILRGKMKHINHIHISEPYLKPIKHRKIHTVLRDCLIREDYVGFISIEMGMQEDMLAIESALTYVREVFLNE